MKVTELIVSLVDPDRSSPRSSVMAFIRTLAHGRNDQPWNASPAGVLVLVLTAHALAAAWTWRDIRHSRHSSSGG